MKMRWIAVCVTLLNFAVFGDDAQEYLAGLINQPDRPTMEQVMRLRQLFPRNPISSGSSSRVQKLREEDDFAMAIAAFERAFPGATFYELGRDAVWVGDALDAFYLSIGQRGRVKRLNASHTSFTYDESLNYDFLLTNGIEVLKPQEYADVIFDTTSFSRYSGVGGGPSQSVRLIKAGYQAYAAAGLDVRELVQKFNFISIGGMFGHPSMSQPSFDPEAFFQAQRKTISLWGFERPFFCDLGAFTYTPAWHGMFGPFKRQPDGSVFAGFLSDSAPMGERTSILAEQYAILETVSDPKFLGAVIAAAGLQGYQFPIKRTSVLERLGASEQQKLRDTFETLKNPQIKPVEKPVKPTTKKTEVNYPFSDRGAQFLQVFEQALKEGQPAEKVLSLILEDALTDPDSLTESDYRGISAAALSSVSSMMLAPNRRLIATLVLLAEKIPPLHDVLVKSHPEHLSFPARGWTGKNLHENLFRVQYLLNPRCDRLIRERVLISVKEEDK